MVETDTPINPDLEITGIQKHLGGGCPVLFNNVKGKPNYRVVTNLFGDINVINKMFGWSDDRDHTRKLAYALSYPIPSIVIDQEEAPCQDVVIENPSEVEDYMVPIRHTEYEPELTVGSGIRVVSSNYFDGGTDLGYNRMNFHWGNVGTFQISPGSHMWQVVSQHYKDDEPVPITMCFSVSPSCTLLASAGFDYVILPQGCDEIGVAGAAQARPVRKQKPQRIGDTQYPLTYRLSGKHFVHQQRRAIGHAPGTTARAKAAAFAAEGHQVLGMTGIAAHPQKTVLQASTLRYSSNSCSTYPGKNVPRAAR